MDHGDAILTRPCKGVTQSTLHASIESPIVLLNPKSTMKAVSDDLVEHTMLSYLMLSGFELERKRGL